LVAKRIEEEFYNRDTKGLTISIGLAEYKNNQSMDEFVRAAETAVQEVKQTNRNSVNIM